MHVFHGVTCQSAQNNDLINRINFFMSKLTFVVKGGQVPKRPEQRAEERIFHAQLN